jgi:hypothetical protein
MLARLLSRPLLVRGVLVNGFAGLGLLKANLSRLARLPSTVARPVADALNAELAQQRGAGTDPYGKPITLGGALPYHMIGTRYRVVRAAIPRGAMPPAWTAAIKRAIEMRGRIQI